MSIRDHLFDRRAGFVTRWHARQVLRHESLAEHQYFVARDVLMICQALHYYGIAEPNTLDAVTLAITHDEVEVETGDISGYAKRRWPQMRELMVGVESGIIEKLLFAALPDKIGDYYRELAMRITLGDDADLEVQIVKYADKLEAYMFATTEVDIGNTLMRDVVVTIGRELDELRWPWLTALRKETGLP